MAGRAKVKHIDLVYPEWEQQPGEDNAQFAKFKVYRGLHYNQSLEATAWALGFKGKELKREICRLGNQSSLFCWRERCKKYEEYLSHLEVAADIKARKDMQRRLAEHATSAELALMTVIQKYLEKYKSRTLDFDNIPIDKLFFMVAKAVEKLTTIGEFERKVRGEPTEKIQQTNLNYNMNYDNLDHDELLKRAKELGFERRFTE